MATTVPMLAPDGTSGEIPADKVQAAMQAGFKKAVSMTSPDGRNGWIPEDRVQDAAKAGFKASFDLSNKQGEGTYNMWDAQGQMHPVPYGQVQSASQRGYKFDTNPNKDGLTPGQQFQKDYNYATTGPGNEAAFAQSDKNAPLPMQAVSGVVKGMGTMAKPALDVVGRLTGVPQKSIDSSMSANTPTEMAGKVAMIGAAAAPSAIVAPVATAGAAVGGTLGAGAGEVIGNVAGMKPENTALLSDTLGAIGGAGGAIGAKPLVNALNYKAQLADAGSLFKSVARDASNVPVSLDNSQDAALRLMDWQKKTNLGPTVNKFLNRITSPKEGPLTYKDARDFYQLLGKLSVDESNKMAPSIKYDLQQMVAGLKQDIGNAADQVGKAADYYQAMGDYARGKRLQGWYDFTKNMLSREAIKGVAKGVGLGAGGALGYEIYKQVQ